MWGAGVAAWTLAKSGTPVFNLSATPFAIVISVTLVALKSMGALLYGLVAYPIILLFSNKAPLRIAGLLCFVFCLYPVVRTTDWFPREAIVDAAARYGNQERAQSLDFRFKNEEVLAERALERPVFGWGRYGRMYVFNEQGKKTSVADGGWIIMLGAGGIVGLVLRFMLLQLPILSAMRRWKTVPPADRLLFTGITLMSAFYSFDLLPNGYFNPIPMFLAGSVMGLSQGMATSTRRAVTPEQVMRWLQSLRRPPRELANARFVNRDQR
jgi:hypothetical protein